MIMEFLGAGRWGEASIVCVAATEAQQLATDVHVDFDVACIGGRRDLVASADRATLTAAVELGVAGDSLVVDIASAEYSLGLKGVRHEAESEEKT